MERKPTHEELLAFALQAAKDLGPINNSNVEAHKKNNELLAQLLNQS